jgi:hypothetical protein
MIGAEVDVIHANALFWADVAYVRPASFRPGTLAVPLKVTSNGVTDVIWQATTDPGLSFARIARARLLLRGAAICNHLRTSRRSHIARNKVKLHRVEEVLED